MRNRSANLAAADRPLALRMRRDLVSARLSFGGQPWIVVKDPVTQSLAYLTQQEHFLLAALDGRASLSEIQRRFAERFAPQPLGAGDFLSFLAELHRSGLVLSDAPDQGEQLIGRRNAKGATTGLSWIENVCAFRWRGVNPEPVLARLEPLMGWLFTPVGLLVWVAAVLLAGMLMALDHGEVARRWPDAAAWLAGNNLVWLAIAVVFVKTLHELGHALAARRVGSRCREIGVQLFFLLPCLYTNVSDVWLVPGKWRRILVSAAGIYVELLLAAVAAVARWWAEPGVLSSLCLNVMLVASVGTLLLNGNPLMRYDGYYVLTDWLEVPNLEQRSRGQLVAWLARWIAGIDWHPADEIDRRPRPWLAAYAAAATGYRIAVVIGIYLAVRTMLEPLRLTPLADLFVAGAAVSMVVPLATTTRQLVSDIRRRGELRPRRLAASTAFIALAIAAVFLVPLPQHVTAPASVEPLAAARIYATVAGQLTDAVRTGTAVKQGQKVAQLENPELRRDLARLISQERQESLHLAELEALRGDDPQRGAAIPAVKKSLADLNARIAQLRELIGRLELAAPQEGVVLPPPKRDAAGDERTLRAWSGTPLDPENRGSLMETGTLVCLVAKPGAVEAIAIVDQSAAPLIQIGQPARIAMAQAASGALGGHVRQIAQVAADDLPKNITATGMLPERRDARGAMRPLATAYQVRIEIDDPPLTLLPGATGRVRIAVAWQPLEVRISRWLSQTFRFARL